MTPHPLQTTQSLLDQIAAIATMERGKLTAEYRTRPSPGGAAPVRLGPCYKLQAWENGRNLSRRVPAAEVPALQEDLANYERLSALTGAFAEATIARTRALRQSAAASTGDASAAATKKNSAKKPAAKGAAKPKPSSPRPGRA